MCVLLSPVHFLTCTLSLSVEIWQVMQLVDGTCHIINKEKMMAEAAAKAGGGGGGESKS